MSVDPRRLRRRRKLGFAVVAGVLILSAVFLVGEILVRLTHDHLDLGELTTPQYHRNPMANWALNDAFCAYTARPGVYVGSPTKTVNEHGFISTPPLGLEKPPGTIRIAFLGGSSTAGTGENLADEDTWPWRTVEELRQQLPEHEFDFINAALGGYATYESFGRLWARIRYFSPDIIVVYHAWNDVKNYQPKRIKGLHRRRVLADGSWSIERLGRPILLYEPLPIDRWIGWSQLLTRFRRKMSPQVQGEVGPPKTGEPLADSFDPRGPEVFRTNIRLIREAAKIFGVRLYVAKQATLVVPDLPESQRQRVRYDIVGVSHDVLLTEFEATYRVIDEEIPQPQIIDTTPLSGQPAFFYDHVHPTPEGARAIASVVADAIARDLDPGSVSTSRALSERHR